MGETIVVGVNDSGPSRAAIDWALERAGSLGLAIELVHVIDERWLGVGAIRDVAVREQGAALIDGERKRATAAAPATTIHGRVITGLPPRALLDASADAELLAIGTHKTGFTFGQSFESTFLRSALRARCAVAIIPEFHSRSRRGVVVVAQTDAKGEPLESAAREAVRLGQELVIVSGWGAASVAGRGPDRRASELEAAASMAKRVDARVSVRPRMSTGTVSEAIIDASTTASVVILSRPGVDPDDPAIAVNHDVLSNISSPVIILGRDPERL